MNTIRQRLRDRLDAWFDRALWKSVSVRRPFDYERMAYLMAAKESAEFFLEHMSKVENLRTKAALLDHALRAVRQSGLWLEFGVYEGVDITKIASAAPAIVYGFDSFEGLPEDWTHFQKKGKFSLGGTVPQLPVTNVELIKGWFDQTLPPFLEKHPEPVAFVHIDSDLYSSAKTVLTFLRPRLITGTVILFDDFLNYPGWKDGESKALFEFAEATGLEFSYIGFASRHHSVAVRVERTVVR